MDEESYTKAVETYLNDVYRLAYSISGNAADAADISQNVFLKLSMQMEKKTFENQAHLKNWLLRCAANEARSLLRSFWKKNVQISDEWVPDEPESIHPEGLLLRSLIEQLSKTDRAIVVLFYWHGYDQKEIAKMLRLTVSTVSTRLYRTRQKLKTMILEDRNEYE